MAELPPGMKELAIQLGRSARSVETFTKAVEIAIGIAYKENGVNANVDCSSSTLLSPTQQQSTKPRDARRLQTPPPTQSPKQTSSNSPRHGIRRQSPSPTLPPRQPARLISPNTGRNRFRRTANSKPVEVLIEDSDGFSNFLDVDDWDSDWSRQAPKKRSPMKRRKLGQTSSKKSKNAQRLLPKSCNVQSHLSTPPPSSDTLPVLRFAYEPEVPQHTTPRTGDKVWRPPGGLVSPTSRKRSFSVSSASSSSSCYSTDDEQLTSFAHLDSAQQLMEQDLRRYRRAKRARKAGLPIPPPTPPPLPPPSSFLSATGLTITGRDLKPEGRSAQQFLGNHGKLGQDKPPHIRKKLRLQLGESRTPVVDTLWCPSQALRYDQKDAIIASLVSKIAAVAKRHPNWRTAFTLQPPASAPKKVQKKRHTYNFDTKGTNCALRTRLASVFGISPYSPDLARIQLEKTLMPLVLANRDAFGMLEVCNIWKPWEGWVVKS